MIYPLNCLLYSYDLYISSPELSPENQNQSTSNSTGSTELFISSPNIFLSLFSQLAKWHHNLPRYSKQKHWIIFSALTPFPHTFWLRVPFAISTSDTQHLFLYLLWWISHWSPFFGQCSSPFYHSGTGWNEWNIYKCISELTILLNNRTTWGPSIQL